MIGSRQRNADASPDPPRMDGRVQTLKAVSPFLNPMAVRQQSPGAPRSLLLDPRETRKPELAVAGTVCNPPTVSNV